MQFSICFKYGTERNNNLLILIGLLAGFAYAVKYTAMLDSAFRSCMAVVAPLVQARDVDAPRAPRSLLIVPGWSETGSGWAIRSRRS